MASRKKTTSSVPEGPPSKMNSGTASDHERFSKELQTLAVKAKDDGWIQSPLGQASLYLKIVTVLSLLGLASHASQLVLSPVFGSIPAGLSHRPVLAAGCFVGWAGNLFLREALPFRPELLLPLLAAQFPLVHFVGGRFSEQMGAWWGPLVIEGLTLFPLCVASAACVADYFESVQLGALPGFVADAAPGIGSWGLFRLAERTAASQLQGFIGRTFLATRVGLQLLVATVYATLAPSKYLALMVPALLHTAVLNTHVMTPMATDALNVTLKAENWTLLDRRESVTGYVSVIEDDQKGVRALRCDHSLLGGEWVKYKGPIISEPIYGVFVMLEAVRLVEREVPIVDEEANALVV